MTLKRPDSAGSIINIPSLGGVTNNDVNEKGGRNHARKHEIPSLSLLMQVMQLMLPFHSLNAHIVFKHAINYIDQASRMMLFYSCSDKAHL